MDYQEMSRIADELQRPSPLGHNIIFTSDLTRSRYAIAASENGQYTRPLYDALNYLDDSLSQTQIPRLAILLCQLHPRTSHPGGAGTVLFAV